jgi:class 3 adenylate cyclase
VARLDANERAKLPDSAFAYIDAHGRRRLPIHDASHVRNALARFGQVAFDDEQARERARRKLLNAAKRFKIVPVGFIDGQLRSEREFGRAQGPTPAPLPSGFVTMLMTDIEASTALLDRLGDGYGELLDGVRALMRAATDVVGGHVVEARADEFFAVFEQPRAALDMAIAVQRQLAARSEADGLEVCVRIGLHSGYPTLRAANYIGMAVHTAARVCSVAHGRQIVVTADTKEATRGSQLDGVRFRSLGRHHLRGLADEIGLYQVVAAGLDERFPSVGTRR